MFRSLVDRHCAGQRKSMGVELVNGSHWEPSSPHPSFADQNVDVHPTNASEGTRYQFARTRKASEMMYAMPSTMSNGRLLERRRVHRIQRDSMEVEKEMVLNLYERLRRGVGCNVSGGEGPRIQMIVFRDQRYSRGNRRPNGRHFRLLWEPFSGPGSTGGIPRHISFCSAVLDRRESGSSSEASMPDEAVELESSRLTACDSTEGTGFVLYKHERWEVSQRRVGSCLHAPYLIDETSPLELPESSRCSPVSYITQTLRG